MPHRASLPRPPSALPPTSASVSNADKPFGWLFAALRRGRGERRTFVRDPLDSPPMAITPGPPLLYPAETANRVTPTPPPPSTPSHRLHPISVETTVAPVPPPLGSPNRRAPPHPISMETAVAPPLGSPNRRATPQAPSSPSRRPNMEMQRGYDLNVAMTEVDFMLTSRPPTPAARRTPRTSCSLSWMRSKKVSPLEPSNECAICLGELFPRSYAGQDEMESMEQQQQRLRCGHVFHAACVQDWLQHQWQKQGEVTCPMCRNSVLPPIIGLLTPER